MGAFSFRGLVCDRHWGSTGEGRQVWHRNWLRAGLILRYERGGARQRQREAEGSEERWGRKGRGRERLETELFSLETSRHTSSDILPPAKPWAPSIQIQKPMGVIPMLTTTMGLWGFSVCVEIRGELTRIRSSLPPVCPLAGPPVIRVGDNCLYLQSHRTDPMTYFEFNVVYSITCK